MGTGYQPYADMLPALRGHATADLPFLSHIFESILDTDHR